MICLFRKDVKMEIQIDKNWKITARPLNIELCKLTKKKNGGTGWGVVGHYQKMEHALDRLFDEKVYESRSTGFEMLKYDLEDLRQKVVSAFVNNPL